MGYRGLLPDVQNSLQIELSVVIARKRRVLLRAITTLVCAEAEATRVRVDVSVGIARERRVLMRAIPTLVYAEAEATRVRSEHPESRRSLNYRQLLLSNFHPSI